MRIRFQVSAVGMVSALDQARRALVTLLRTLAELMHNPRAVLGPLSEKLTHRRSESSWDFAMLWRDTAFRAGSHNMDKTWKTAFFDVECFRCFAFVLLF